MTTAQLALFLPAAALVALSPGANNLLAFGNASRAGWRVAVRALSGRLTAFVLMVCLVALGLGAMLQTSELAFRVVKWAGVAYLVWLAIATWRAPATALPQPRGLARREFLTAMGNPKAYLLFTAFLPQFVIGDEGVARQLLALGAFYIAVEAVAASLWAGAGALWRRGTLSARGRGMMNRISGVMMLGAAGLLARTSR